MTFYDMDDATLAEEIDRRLQVEAISRETRQQMEHELQRRLEVRGRALGLWEFNATGQSCGRWGIFTWQKGRHSGG